MPYFKCVPCKIRVSAAGPVAELVNGACPDCGSSLQAVESLNEVLGFRSADLFDPTRLPRVAQRVSDISGGRAAAQAQLDSDRWLNEGGSLAPEALAKAVALQIPPRT